VTAIVRGTSEVAMPVIASTLTTVAVFFPIVFVEGVAGQVFGDMALAVVFSQIASLIAALYLIPMLAAKLASPVHADGALATTAARMQSSTFLQFPALAHDSSRIVLAARVLGLVLARFGWALAVIVAVIAKALVALLWTPIAFGLNLVPATRGKGRAIEAWLVRDALGPIQSARVWPGMLAFPFRDPPQR
jgi:HAE1 family hydrophobic/amphiphilic exporter-1